MQKAAILTLFITLFSTLAASETEQSDLSRLQKETESQKKEHPYNLPNHDFRSTNFDLQQELVFQGSNFQGGNFSGTPEKPKIIQHIDFSNCDLSQANFSDCIITKCQFTNANLHKALFVRTKIKYAGFNGANLVDANFSDSDQESVSYDAADIRNSIWENANIFRVSFTRTDERGIKTKGLKESHCSHEGAKTTGFFERLFGKS
ncbi:MAG: pentapeptide repeat-containing protein [Verrucomicrobia bacterium]|nr:pentapeptide repeat-containing protein [Verrucomicrobiota bacterium]